MNEKNQEEKKDQNSLSLSEALLAPLNSIFEAQIHASRAFLNFFLQMGFRHKYTEEDKEKLNEDPRKNKEILDLIEEEEKGKDEIETLVAAIQELKAKTQLTDIEKQQTITIEKRLRELKTKWGDLYHQSFEYFDQNGTERILSIPNLSLLPIRPLAIQSANFKFELRVKDEIKSMDSPIRSATRAMTKRPWFLIEDPKEIKGEYVPQQNENSTDKTIKIDVTIGSVEIPYGLSKLISSLTNTTDVVEKTNPII